MLQVTGNMLQLTGYRLQVTSHRLQVTGYREQVTGNRLQVPFLYMISVLACVCVYFFFKTVVFSSRSYFLPIFQDYKILPPPQQHQNTSPCATPPLPENECTHSFTTLRLVMNDLCVHKVSTAQTTRLPPTTETLPHQYAHIPTQIHTHIQSNFSVCMCTCPCDVCVCAF